MARQLLIVDDEASIRESLAAALADEHTEIRVAADGRRGLEMVGEAEPDLVIADVRMPGMDGLALLRVLRSQSPSIAIVLMTAFDDMPTVATAMREGAADFLVKPLDLHELRRVVTRVFEDRQTRSRPTTAAEALIRARETPELIGRDPKMIEIYKKVGQVAAARTNVLIRGESGTGKELIARAIHEHSPEAAEPFVTVNCSALPPTLLESELFGHARGAFTGAVSARRGRFAQAGKGTIFLDEIGDTTLDFQSKLLRVLQEHDFQPVGSERPERAEARVIAATHRHLEEMVALGQFREDLYYRLRVVELVIPPLRDRPGDVPLLVTHLVARASQALRRPEPVIASDALDAIRRHGWPGNVRELENSLRQAVVLARGDVIRPEHLGLASINVAPIAMPGTLPTLAVLERDHVARVFASTGQRKTKTARILGVSRPRLNRLLKQYGLE